MEEKGKYKPKLRLIRGSKDFKISIGFVQIFVAPENIPPFMIDAVAAEEDTYLVLSAGPEAPEADLHGLKAAVERRLRPKSSAGPRRRWRSATG